MLTIKQRKMREIGRIVIGTIVFLGLFWLIIVVAAVGNQTIMYDKTQQQEHWTQAVATPEQSQELEQNEEETESSIEESIVMSTEESVEESTELQEQPKEVTIMAVGDNLMHVSVTYSGLQADGSWDFSYLFANVKEDAQEADISILCQEVMMGGEELGITGYPEFNTVQEIGHGIVDAGFNVVAFANNHTMDSGATGILNTLHFWKEQYPEVSCLGIHESLEEQNTITIVEKNGIKIALLNYTYGVNGNRPSVSQSYLMDFLDNREKVAADLQKARELADFIIVLPHWGTEYSHEIDDAQKETTQFFADQGVDLVIGSHPHVVQPVQWIDREGYANPMLVYYSLGNFVSIQDKTNRMVGGMAKVTIQKDENGTMISDHGLELLVTQYESHPGDTRYSHITSYPLDLYTPEIAQRHAITIVYDKDFSYEAVWKLAQWLMSRVE